MRTIAAMLLLVLVVLELGSLSQTAVQQAAPEMGVGGFLEMKRYAYSYLSTAAIHNTINITLQAQVSLLHWRGR